MSERPNSEIERIASRLRVVLSVYSSGTVTNRSTSSALSPVGSVNSSTIGCTGSGYASMSIWEKA